MLAPVPASTKTESQPTSRSVNRMTPYDRFILKVLLGAVGPNSYSGAPPVPTMYSVMPAGRSRRAFGSCGRKRSYR